MPKSRRQLAAYVLLAQSIAAAVPSGLLAQIGPDVLVGQVGFVEDYARDAQGAALSIQTFACNVGDERLNWYELPSNRHPAIAQNMYRLHEGRLEQIGQAWVKHGFAAINYNNPQACGVTGCQSPGHVYQLGVNCSDPYDSFNNRGPFLGPRWEINPVTGYFNGSEANNHTGHIHTSVSHGLRVLHGDLAIAGARYFVEAQYVASDDALAGNGNNNVSHREVRVTGVPTNWTFANVGGTFRGLPAIFSWPEATISIIDSWPEEGRLIVAHKVSDKGGVWRYEYAIYNQSSDRGIRTFQIPVGSAKVSRQGFHAVLSHDDPYFNLEWDQETSGGFVIWQTPPPSAPNVRTNPIRWGTMYNFWFDADAPPRPGYAELLRFKGGVLSDEMYVAVSAPGAGDCNGNRRSDDEDITSGFSQDDDGDSLPDECIPCFRTGGCGNESVCVQTSCELGWCASRFRLFGDVNSDNRLTSSDLICAMQAFARLADCAAADVAGCAPDGVVNVDDVLAVLSASEDEAVCCEP